MNIKGLVRMQINNSGSLIKPLLNMTLVKSVMLGPNSLRGYLMIVLMSLCSCSPVSLMDLPALPQPKGVILSSPSPIQTLPVKWEVITTEKPLSTLPQYCLTPQYYKNLSLTQADTLRWITETQWQLEQYRSEGDNEK